jgi:hypothetical protein
MRNILFALASVTMLVMTVPSSAQYGAPVGGAGTGLSSGNNGQWRDNNWRNGPANDWRSNNWREDRTDDWRSKNWREDRTDDWRPREYKPKDNEKNNTKNKASDEDCGRAPNSPNSYANAQCR